MSRPFRASHFLAYSTGRCPGLVYFALSGLPSAPATATPPAMKSAKSVAENQSQRPHRSCFSAKLPPPPLRQAPRPAPSPALPPTKTIMESWNPVKKSPVAATASRTNPRKALLPHPPPSSKTSAIPALPPTKTIMESWNPVKITRRSHRIANEPAQSPPPTPPPSSKTSAIPGITANQNNHGIMESCQKSPVAATASRRTRAQLPSPPSAKLQDQRHPRHYRQPKQSWNHGILSKITRRSHRIANEPARSIPRHPRNP